MFNKKESEELSVDKKDIETIIGASVKVEGNFVCEGNMIIDGQVKGNVQTNGFLQIGKSAIVTADVKAANARISGEVRGNLKIETNLELGETAKIIGDIDVINLSVQKGAQINGRCTMNNKSNSKAKDFSKDVVVEE